MIPLRDNQPSPTVPIGVYALMAINSLVFLWEIQAGFDNQAFFYHYGLVPAKYTVWEVSRYFSLGNKIFSLVSYMFFHAGFWHFVGNMWFLYIFGDNIESRMGTLKFLGFYLICGMVSGFFHFLLNLSSSTPTIGASGAVAGVMGAYFLLFPRSKILTLVPIVIFPLFFEIPAFVFLGFWFFMQFINAAGSGASAGVAWWAHVGGFLAGMGLARFRLPVSAASAGTPLGQIRKKHAPSLQMILPQSLDDGPDLHGDIEISSLEALTGTKKVVTIPWGFYKPLYRVTIPPGIRQGTRLRLAGMGKTVNGRKGDLFLMVQIKNIV